MKQSTDVNNIQHNAPIDQFTAKVIVNKKRLRDIGILNGTTVEVKVYERGSDEHKRTVYMVSGRHGETALVKRNEIQMYDFSDVNIPEDELADLFDHA